MKYAEAILLNRTWKLWWFQITKMLTAVLKNKFGLSIIIIFHTLSFPRDCKLPPILPPGKLFKRPKSSPVRLLACNWHYCAQFVAKPTQFFKDQMPFLPPNQQRQSTEDTSEV